MIISEFDVNKFRKMEAPIADFILQRWSARAMTGASLPQAELLRLFEAARWAPSAGNAQGWFFLAAHAGLPEFERFFSLLDEWNQEWCRQASVLLVVLSNRLSPSGKPNRTHAYDTGSAFENLALQAIAMGLVVHPMAGFYRDRARDELNIPENFDIYCMVALGYPAEVDTLSEYNKPREFPNQRKPLESFYREGGFPDQGETQSQND